MTGFSPFYIIYGRHPDAGTSPRRQVRSHGVAEFAKNMEKIHEEAKLALLQAQETMKRHHDAHKKVAREYKKGDQVWLEGTNIKTDRPMKKLDNKQHGPFPIIEKVGESAYKLNLPEMWKKVHPVFHEALLTPYTLPEYLSQKKPEPLPPIIIDNEEEYKIEELMDSKFVRNKLKYLVKWRGYPNQANWTWEPEDKILWDNKDKFHENHPSTP